jgi:lipoate-protein ligase A
MLIYYRPYTDPYLNIAAEEYWVKHSDEDICMIWVNEPSVIIGKHQNAFAEINYPYVRSNKIPVIRRISGGGAVYHDRGNVNFSFILKTGKTNQVDFGKFTSIIANFMQSLGIEVNVSKRNSLYIGINKFSGHAEHIFHDKVLHHGTMLFNTNLNALQQSLTPVKEYQSKAMPSERSNVMNLAPLLPGITDIQKFIQLFTLWLKDYFEEAIYFIPEPNQLQEIKLLAEKKYTSWDWNFGYSPAYSFQADILTKSGIIPITCKIENGKFVSATLPEEYENNLLAGILHSFNGLLHKEEEIDKFVEKNKLKLELAGINTVNFSEAFFR